MRSRHRRTTPNSPCSPRRRCPRRPALRTRSPPPALASGLPWRSGASCGHGAFEAWRGRKLDVQVQFVWHDSWDQMAARMNSPYFRTALTWTPQPVVSLAMLPTSARQQHAACAKGAFDGYFRQFGRILTAAGAGDAIVRIGWEPNTGTHSHPWGFDTADQVPGYVGCFRHAAAALRATMPGVRIEWGVSKAGVWTFSVLDAYPGDAYVDLIGAALLRRRLAVHDAAGLRQVPRQHALRRPAGAEHVAPGGHRPRQASGRARVGRVDAAPHRRRRGQPGLHPGHVPVLQGERGQDRLRELLQLLRRPPARHDHPVPERERHVSRGLWSAGQ